MFVYSCKVMFLIPCTVWDEVRVITHAQLSGVVVCLCIKYEVDDCIPAGEISDWRLELSHSLKEKKEKEKKTV